MNWMFINRNNTFQMKWIHYNYNTKPLKIPLQHFHEENYNDWMNPCFTKIIPRHINVNLRISISILCLISLYTLVYVYILTLSFLFTLYSYLLICCHWSPAFERPMASAGSSIFFVLFICFSYMGPVTTKWVQLVKICIPVFKYYMNLH